jgi:hypothetical protein
LSRFGPGANPLLEKVEQKLTLYPPLGKVEPKLTLSTFHKLRWIKVEQKIYYRRGAEWAIREA